MIVFTIGLPSSASTWVYNVVRAILAANGLEHASFIGETLGDFIHADIRSKTHAVVKGHRFEGGLHQIIQLAGSPSILSLRDPRDATASLVQRFGQDAGVSAAQVNRSLVSICALADACEHLAFFFEQRFPDHEQSIRDIADYLKLGLCEAQTEAIFHKFKAETIRELTASVSGYAGADSGGECAGGWTDADTHFHHNHITDRRIGKWSSFFDPATAEALDDLFFRTAL